MNEDKKKCLFDRMIYYGEIHQTADVSKIANLAYEERNISFLELLDVDGLEYIKENIDNISNSKITLGLLVLLAPFDREFALMKYRCFLNKKDEAFLIGEPWGLKNMQDNDFHKKTKEYLLKLSNKKNK